MSEQSDEGTIIALLDRFRLQRLPIALEIKQQVDAGGKLTDREIEFLEKVFTEAQEVKPLVERHPELAQLVQEVMGLYKHITTKALENEQRG